MAAYPPPEIAEGEETYAWNAIARGYDRFMGSDPEQFPEKQRRFVAGLKQQLAVNNQGEAFFKAATVAIGMLEAPLSELTVSM